MPKRLRRTPILPGTRAAEFLRVIFNESDRMTKIVQDLLELSRFDADRITLTPVAFSLERSLRDVYAAIRVTAEKRNQAMTLDTDNFLPQIVGDRSRIEQVLMNIITNAVKYTPDGGEIKITSGAEGEFVFVEVADTGLGIPEEDLPHVFDRFYRVDKARSRESGGTGLGLSIAHEIVVRHGGEITVSSVLGEGSVFRLVLPIRGQ